MTLSLANGCTTRLDVATLALGAVAPTAAAIPVDGDEPGTFVAAQQRPIHTLAGRTRRH
jgi:hypothetical protein